MRSVRLHEPRDLRLHEEPTPEPGLGEALIRVRSVGVCASDGHWYRDGRIGTTKLSGPLILGHEASGVITKLGDGVTGHSLGDRVAIEPARPCMKCEWCLSGRYNVCPGIPFFGTPPTDGCFRDYVVWPAHLALKAPGELSFDEIAMLEPLAVGMYACELAQISNGDTVLVMGAGAIGLSAIQAAKVMGAGRLIVSEPVEARRKLALKLGAARALDPTSGNVEAQVMEITNGRGADIVLECAGEDDATRQSGSLVRVLGKVLVIGIPDSDTYAFDASVVRRKQVTAIFVRRSNQTTEKAMEWVKKGLVDVACYATHRFPLEETRQAVELMLEKSDGVVRSVVVVSE